VLLLDDDSCFNDVTKLILCERGYTVVSVGNGGEGIREVLGGDFEVVLCDLMMPSLSGDLFYQAVERIRPRLCARFVFMTGLRDDQRTGQFLTEIDSRVLRKPFAAEELLEAVAATAARVRAQERAESALGDAAANLLPAGGESGLRTDGAGGDAAMPWPVEAPRLMRSEPWQALGPSSPEPEAGGAAGRLMVAVLVLLVFFGGILAIWRAKAEERAAAAVAERVGLEAEWKGVAPRFEEAGRARRGFASLPKRVKRLAEERATVGWTPVLRSIAVASPAEIEWRAVAARTVVGPPEGCELRLEGMAAGGAPRVAVNDCFRAVRGELERKFAGQFSLVLEKLDDAPDSSAGAEGPRASFALSIRLGASPAPGGRGEVAP